MVAPRWLSMLGVCVLACTTAEAPTQLETKPAPEPATPPELVTPLEPATPPEQANAPVTLPTGAALTVLRSVGTKLYKPPNAAHQFDLRLENPVDEPRWMLVPTTFAYPDRDDLQPGGTLEELQVYELSSSPRVVIAKAVGPHFWALRLPGRGHVTIRGLKIESWWETNPATAPLELLIASEVRVGDQTLESCMGTSALSESGADVKAPTDVADPRVLPFWHAEDHRSVPVEIQIESRDVVEATINPEQPPREP